MGHKININHICPKSPINAHWWIGTNAREDGWELFQCHYCQDINWLPIDWETAMRVARQMNVKRPPGLSEG